MIGRNVLFTWKFDKRATILFHSVISSQSSSLLWLLLLFLLKWANLYAKICKNIYKSQKNQLTPVLLHGMELTRTHTHIQTHVRMFIFLIFASIPNHPNHPSYRLNRNSFHSVYYRLLRQLAQNQDLHNSVGLCVSSRPQ